jgi:hypothetical protein
VSEWTGIINWEDMLIRCPVHGEQKLVPASRLDDCMDCEACVLSISRKRKDMINPLDIGEAAAIVAGGTAASVYYGRKIRNWFYRNVRKGKTRG